MEQSGLLSPFIDGVVMSGGQTLPYQTLYVKPYIPISPIYHIYDGLSNLYSLKNPIEKYPNLPRKPEKNI